MDTAKSSKLPADMIAWFQEKQYDDYSDVAMACATAEATETKFVNPMKASDVKSATDDGIGVVNCLNLNFALLPSGSGHCPLTVKDLYPRWD